VQGIRTLEPLIKNKSAPVLCDLNGLCSNCCPSVWLYLQNAVAVLSETSRVGAPTDDATATSEMG